MPEQNLVPLPVPSNWGNTSKDYRYLIQYGYSESKTQGYRASILGVERQYAGQFTRISKEQRVATRQYTRMVGDELLIALKKEFQPHIAHAQEFSSLDPEFDQKRRPETISRIRITDALTGSMAQIELTGGAYFVEIGHRGGYIEQANFQTSLGNAGNLHFLDYREDSGGIPANFTEITQVPYGGDMYVERAMGFVDTVSYLQRVVTVAWARAFNAATSDMKAMTRDLRELVP